MFIKLKDATLPVLFNTDNVLIVFNANYNTATINSKQIFAIDMNIEPYHGIVFTSNFRKAKRFSRALNRLIIDNGIELPMYLGSENAANRLILREQVEELISKLKLTCISGNREYLQGVKQ